MRGLEVEAPWRSVPGGSIPWATARASSVSLDPMVTREALPHLVPGSCPGSLMPDDLHPAYAFAGLSALAVKTSEAFACALLSVAVKRAVRRSVLFVAVKLRLARK